MRRLPSLLFRLVIFNCIVAFTIILTVDFFSAHREGPVSAESAVRPSRSFRVLEIYDTHGFVVRCGAGPAYFAHTVSQW